MSSASAEMLTARERLAAIGWIAPRSEYFRHLPPPGADVWLGDAAAGSTAVTRPDDTDGWAIETLDQAPQARVDAEWLDATEAVGRNALFDGTPAPGDGDVDRFAWAHQALCRRGLRLRIGAGDRPARPGESVRLALRRTARAALEAPALVVDVAPGMHCVLVEAHERDAGADAVVQNLQLHVRLGDGARLQHLRVVVPASADQVAHRVHASLARGARYEQALIASGSRYHLQRTELDLHAAQSAARTGGALFAAGSALEQQVEVLHGGVATHSDVESLMLASGKARGVVNAITRIAPGATDASVRQRLSGIPTGGQPRLVLRPHLEICHDQVQAVHGATWGSLPEDALFYARQRGLDERSARALIVEGLLAALLERSLGDPELLQSLGVAARLSSAVTAHLAADAKERIA
ncbi:MAG: SufD family Fe-S cluster assembly protein [Proteobacteria bacterium]|nr:SufD family Fe-S cluster assembly protein [Pseudomonadota bacterium]